METTKSSMLRDRYYLYLVGNLRSDLHGATPYIRTIRNHRLTNAFSKKLDNRKAAVALYIAWYNFCRVHQTLRVTPAMEAGLTDHVLSISDLFE